jgi:MoaA/NifB/PqqE/SkfB family radical SAM enzyme
MSWEFYTRIVKQMRDLGVEALGVFYLGESFLCDWLADAIRYAKRECGYPYVFLTTNGRLATVERVRSCMLGGLDSLKFSFNFCDPRQFTDSTGASAVEYRTVVNNIRDARWIRDYVADTTGHRCGIYASSLLYDDEQRERMRDAVDKILPYVDEHYWLPLFGYPPPPPCTTGSPAVLTKPLPCWSLFTEAHITHDGRLSACCFDHSARYSMGDLDETPFMDAWHGRPFRELRAAHLAGDVTGTACEKCISYEP